MKKSDLVTIARLMSLELRHLLCEGKPQEAFEIADILSRLPIDEHDTQKSLTLVASLNSYFTRNEERCRLGHLTPLREIIALNARTQAA